MLARFGLVLAAAILLCACGGATHPAPKLLALGSYMVGGEGGFEATSLLSLDPRTLRTRTGLRLGDAAAGGIIGSSFVFSPDRRRLVFAGLNSGELLFVDPARLRITRRLKVDALRALSNVDVEIVGWPRRDLLVVATSLDGAWWAPHPARLLLIDPVNGRVLRQTAVGGELDGGLTTSDGTIVLLRTAAGSGGVQRGIPALLVVSPSGRIRQLTLSPLTLEGREHLRLGGTSFRAERTAGLATDAGRRAFVVAAGRPIAEVDVPTLHVTYHEVRVPDARFSVPAVTPGSAGVHLRFSRSAAWLGRNLLEITGEDELPARVGDPIVGHRLDPIRVQLVDTSTWRVSRSLPVTGCQRAGELVLCSGGVRIRRSGADAFDTGLVAYDRHWRVRYRQRAPLYWSVVAGRLLVGHLDNTITEVDPRTGKRLRRVRPPDSWLPYDMVRWPSPG